MVRLGHCTVFSEDVGRKVAVFKELSRKMEQTTGEKEKKEWRVRQDFDQ